MREGLSKFKLERTFHTHNKAAMCDYFLLSVLNQCDVACTMNYMKLCESVEIHHSPFRDKIR